MFIFILALAVVSCLTTNSTHLFGFEQYNLCSLNTKEIKQQNKVETNISLLPTSYNYIFSQLTIFDQSEIDKFKLKTVDVLIDAFIFQSKTLESHKQVGVSIPASTCQLELLFSINKFRGPPLV